MGVDDDYHVEDCILRDMETSTLERQGPHYADRQRNKDQYKSFVKLNKFRDSMSI